MVFWDILFQLEKGCGITAMKSSSVGVQQIVIEQNLDNSEFNSIFFIYHL